MICCRLIFPSLVRFQIGAINLAIYDFLLFFLFISFFINKGWKTNQNAKFPKQLGYFFSINYISSFILIILSSYATPFSTQIGFLAKNLVIEIPTIILCYYALRGINLSLFTNYLVSTSIIVGLYGIWVYYKQINPYTLILTLVYGYEQDIMFFLEESRGGLTGRTSGTMLHPLTWGQMWNLILAIYIIIRKHINNKTIDFTLISLAIINIVLSGSRSSIVCTLILASFLINKASIIKIIKLFPIIILTIILISSTNEKVYDYIKSGIFFWDESYSEKADISGSNVSMRTEQFISSIEFASNNAIGGLGYNSIAYLGSDNVEDNMRGFESIIFKKLYEQGFIGLIMFFIYYYIYYLFIKNQFKETNKLYRQIVVGYFCCYLVSICFTGIQNTWTIFLLLPLCLCGNHINSLPHQKTKY